MIVIVPTTTKATIAPTMRPIMANGLMVIAMVYFLVLIDRNRVTWLAWKCNLEPCFPMCKVISISCHDVLPISSTSGRFSAE